MVVSSRKIYDLRVALKNAGVDMGKARRRSEGALKAAKTAKAKKGKG